MRTDLTVVNQRGAKANRDVIAGSKTVNVNNFYNGGVIEQLTAKLLDEMAAKQEIEHTVSALACWAHRPVLDGVEGLEAKLNHAGRNYQVEDALLEKEEFEKLLLEWSLFGSAQEIFAIYLGKIEHEFKYNILPQITDLNKVGFNELVTTKIVDPIVFQNGPVIFSINHKTVMGMFYWLAERCYVRWHA